MKLDGLKVMLVEDDIFILMDLQMVLEDAGAKVVTATNVAEGLSIATDTYNAAVLDIRLPDGEVFPVAEALAARNTPLIFHSGNSATSHLDKRFPEAIALSKPVSDAVLIDAVHQLSTAA